MHGTIKPRVHLFNTGDPKLNSYLACVDIISKFLLYVYIFYIFLCLVNNKLFLIISKNNV